MSQATSIGRRFCALSIFASFAEWVVEQGVASPAGVSVSECVDERGWGGTTITGCKPDEVLPLLKGQLPEAVYLAIEGEVE